MEKKKTLVIGASANPNRYSYLAINKLVKYGHPVVAIGNRKATIADVDVDTEKISYKNIDTVTLYINPGRQQEYYNYILSLSPKRIIFNPGTENDELEKLALKNNIIAQEACTLVLLGTNQF